MKIFLMILAVLFLLLCVPFKLYFDVGKTTQLWLGWLFFKRRIAIEAPAEKKPKKEKPAKAAKTAKKAKPQKEKVKLTPRQLLRWADFGLGIVQRLPNVLKSTLRSVRVTNFSLVMFLTGDDAEEAALKYGRISAAVYNGVCAVASVVTMSIKEMNINPAFYLEEDEVHLSGIVKVVPLLVLGAGLNILMILFKEYTRSGKNHRQEKPAQQEDKADGKSKSRQ